MIILLVGLLPLSSMVNVIESSAVADIQIQLRVARVKVLRSMLRNPIMVSIIMLLRTYGMTLIPLRHHSNGQ
jgi:hypothetical protein